MQYMYSKSFHIQKKEKPNTKNVQRGQKDNNVFIQQNSFQ